MTQQPQPTERELLEQSYQVICGLINAIYQDNNLGEKQSELYELGFKMSWDPELFVRYITEELPTMTAIKYRQAYRLTETLTQYLNPRKGI